MRKNRTKQVSHMFKVLPGLSIHKANVFVFLFFLLFNFYSAFTQKKNLSVHTIVTKQRSDQEENERIDS